jgi:SAM-dependent methyltransferase
VTNVGTGPGVITPDGCAVEFYARLPVLGEPEIVHAAVPSDASILELGCGTGRILKRLAALGHPVTGVDESPEMLAHLGDLPAVCAPIEGLRLGRSFDAVLLASTLVNTPDPVQRRGFLDACRANARDGGAVVVQRHQPSWFDTVVPSFVERGGLAFELRDVVREDEVVSMTAVYTIDSSTWTHRFTSRRLGDDAIVAVLAGSGLSFESWLTEDRAWLLARVRSA